MITESHDHGTYSPDLRSAAFLLPLSHRHDRMARSEIDFHFNCLKEEEISLRDKEDRSAGRSPSRPISALCFILEQLGLAKNNIDSHLQILPGYSDNLILKQAHRA